MKRQNCLNGDKNLSTLCQQFHSKENYIAKNFNVREFLEQNLEPVVVTYFEQLAFLLSSAKKSILQSYPREMRPTRVGYIMRLKLPMKMYEM